MNIVVLDGYTLNPGDLSWSKLEKFGRLTVYERTPDDQIMERALDADIIFTNKTSLRGDVLKQLKQLRYIGVLATGYDNVDIMTAKEQGIVVTNVPTYGTASVAQFTFALLLDLCNHVHVHHLAVQRGQWASSPDFSLSVKPQMELTGKTLGIVGYGTIGAKVAELGRAFGMNILAFKRSPSPDIPFQEFQWVSLEVLLKQSDVISLHSPLTPETEKMINTQTLALMKPTALLINTARGKLIDEHALADALTSGQIAGAGLDVLSSEPPVKDHPLIGIKNCIITPHIAWASFEARQRMLEIAVNNLKSFIEGDPIHVVNQ